MFRSPWIEGLSVLQHEIMRATFNDGSYYLQPMFMLPLLVATVIVVVVLIIAYACIRKTRNQSENACKWNVKESKNKTQRQLVVTIRIFNFGRQPPKYIHTYIHIYIYIYVTILKTIFFYFFFFHSTHKQLF